MNLLLQIPSRIPFLSHALKFRDVGHRKTAVSSRKYFPRRALWSRNQLPRRQAKAYTESSLHRGVAFTSVYRCGATAIPKYGPLRSMKMVFRLSVNLESVSGPPLVYGETLRRCRSETHTLFDLLLHHLVQCAGGCLQL